MHDDNNNTPLFSSQRIIHGTTIIARSITARRFLKRENDLSNYRCAITVIQMRLTPIIAWSATTLQPPPHPPSTISFSSSLLYLKGRVLENRHRSSALKEKHS
ncbi:hypothetical protein CEXT_525911 [Caerostris extrusa]|uniref:Uncharacterized protein n=1 Tax=Caerostris extrusa TaxID=172846 RepID=A0AAV4PJD0_CAEEX|nr:hypothetical protein CEXT_525911 [Caerostris extrusa]